jgi:prefoldin subunit 5
MMLAVTLGQGAVGTAVALGSLVLGYLGYLRSRAADDVAIEVGLADVQRQSIGQVINGLHKLVASLQADNKDLRGHIDSLESKIDRIVRECEELRRELRALHAKWGDSQG